MKEAVDERILIYVVLWIYDWVWHYLASGDRGSEWSANFWEAVSISIMVSVLTVSAWGSSNTSLSFGVLGRAVLGAGLAFRTVGFVHKAPRIWDSDYWCIMTDSFVIIALITNLGVEVAGECVRIMMAFFYFAAAFWKLNTSFFDYQHSCASVFFQQIYAQVLNLVYLDHFEGEINLAILIAKVAPTLTLMLEFAVGGSMLFALVKKKYTGQACLFALLLHFVICLTPPPNNISPFALKCVVRLVFFANPRPLQSIQSSLLRLFLLAVTMATGLTLFYSRFPQQPKMWATPLYVIAALNIALILLNEKEIPKRKVHTYSFIKVLAGLVAFSYSFLTILFGVAEQGTPNMFANLKIHGGSNHFLLPTGLCFHHRIWPYHQGVVRIENTNSPIINDLYPADMTSFLMPERAVTILQAIAPGGGPVYFNSGFTRVLGNKAPQDESSFVRYSLPAIELQRLFQEAIKGPDFNLTYAILPGTSGDEQWRAYAQDERVHISVNAHTITSCQLEFAQAECSEAHLSSLTDKLPWFASKFSLYHPYPIIPPPTVHEEGGQHFSSLPSPSIRCFGP